MLYGRQSQLDEESISLAAQLAANQRHSDDRDYDVVAHLDDPGVSGRKWAKRPGILEAVRMITDGEADVIVVWKWSRFSRNRYDQAVGFDRVESVGGRVESSTEHVDTTTASGRLHRGMLSEFAAFESERIGEVWKEAHANRRGRGVPHNGGDRYGYRREWRPSAGQGDRGYWAYLIDEGDDATDDQPARRSPAEALRLAYAWYIDGRGANRIVDELNRRGYRNRIGERFKRHGLYDLLDSGFAAGLIVHRPDSGAAHRSGHVEYHRGAHPPIIGAATWEAYLARRRARAWQQPATKGSRHPLSGLMRCGDCGAGMTSYSTPGPTNPHGTRPTYACNAWRRLGSEWVRCVTTTRPRAEREVRSWLEQLAGDVETAASADRKVRRRQRSARTDLERATAEVRKIEGQLAELAVMRVRGDIAAAGYDEARATLEADLRAATTTAEEAEVAATERPVASQTTAGRLARSWDTLPPEDVRAGLATLLRGVWVFPPSSRGHGSRVHVVPWWEPAPKVTPPPIPDAPARR